jgi:kinesin family protein 5
MSSVRTEAVRERLAQAKALKTQGASNNTFNFGRIAKPLRGGGGGAVDAAAPADTASRM